MSSPNFMQIEEYFKFRSNYKKINDLLNQIDPIIDYELPNGFGDFIEEKVGIEFLRNFAHAQDAITKWTKSGAVDIIKNGSYDERDIKFREFNEMAADLREAYGGMLELYDKYVEEVLLKEE